MQIQREKKEIGEPSAGVFDDLSRGSVNVRSLNREERIGAPRGIDLKDSRHEPRVRYPGRHEESTAGAVERITFLQSPHEIHADLGGDRSYWMKFHIGVNIEVVGGSKNRRFGKIVQCRIGRFERLEFSVVRGPVAAGDIRAQGEPRTSRKRCDRIPRVRGDAPGVDGSAGKGSELIAGLNRIVPGSRAAPDAGSRCVSKLFADSFRKRGSRQVAAEIEKLDIRPARARPEQRPIEGPK